MALMVTISGVRGIIGESLFPKQIEKYVAAFGSLQKGKKIILGRDSRVSGPFVRQLVIGVLMAQGYEVIDLGIVPTPTVQIIVQQEKAAGGIVVTSSHNPVQWNGLKFIDSDGLFLSPEKCKEMYKNADDGAYSYMKYDQLGSLVETKDANDRHINTILNLDYIKKDEIAKQKLKICLDTVNGAGGPIMKQLLETFGCEVVGMNLETSGLFAHTPEPVPQNLGDLCKAVKENGADLGIATDPDVDRCVLIDENGVPLGEEYTLALAVEFYLGHCGKRGVVCKNLSSSKAIDDIAAKYDCKCIATPVGEIQVAKRMVAENAVIGGEGNGGVMLPDIHIGRDAPIAAAMALSLLCATRAKTGNEKLTISELKATLPQYEIVKLKAPIKGINPDEVVEFFRKEWEGKADLNDSDGLRIQTDDWWIHLRKSNTEPIIRVIGEQKGSLELSQARCNEFLEKIKSFSK